jgi:hypothetical protein
VVSVRVELSVVYELFLEILVTLVGFYRALFFIVYVKFYGAQKDIRCDNFQRENSSVIFGLHYSVFEKDNLNFVYGLFL